MGIPQLLPFLKKSTRNCHISEFRGKTVAVDTYCWLHKGAYTCAPQLVKGLETDSHIQYCMKFVRLLCSFDIKPIMVFDGRLLPAKRQTEEKRRESKKQARRAAMELERLGKPYEAAKYFNQCIDVTPKMALTLMVEGRKMNVDCIVAPYEADAQLAYFSINDIADLVISEDSDLLLFGCKKVLYKMGYNGSGELVEADKIHLSMGLRPEQYTFEKFRHMCILSGCDYLDSLPGVGLKKALKFVNMTVQTDPSIFIDKVPHYLKLKKVLIPLDYKENYLIAEATFKHQLVFDVENRILIPLTSVENIQYCINAGEFFDNNLAYELALGNLDPLTMQSIGDWYPKVNSSQFSIWNSREDNPQPLRLPTPKSSTVYNCKIADAKMLENSNAQYDKQIQKELEMYKTQIAPSVTVVENNHTFEEDSNSETSPILSKNPFKKKRNMSDVNISEHTVIVSRFFSSSINNESFIPLSEASYVLTPPAGFSEYAEDIAQGFELDENNGATMSSNSDVASLPDIECEVILETDDVNITFDDCVVMNVEENLPGPSDDKKRKRVPDKNPRRVGVKKQLTMLDMWKRMQKS